MSDLAPVLQEFFTRRLVSQRDASPATIAAYRDTFRLLLSFAAARAGKKPSALGLADLDAPAITAFLEHLQTARGTAPRPATPGWQRSTPCSPMRPCAFPSMPR
jgi:hypothetical protein